MTVKGGCRCGAVRYALEALPPTVLADRVLSWAAAAPLEVLAALAVLPEEDGR